MYVRKCFLSGSLPAARSKPFGIDTIPSAFCHWTAGCVCCSPWAVGPDALLPSCANIMRLGLFVGAFSKVLNIRPRRSSGLLQVFLLPAGHRHRTVSCITRFTPSSSAVQP